MKRIKIVTGFTAAWIILALFMSFPTNSNAASDEDRKNIQYDASMPVYHPPVPDKEIRRREGGENAANRGWSRGFSRGFSRGGSRGWSRGWSRSGSRGWTRGWNRGGLPRGWNRGGLPRGGLPRGWSRKWIRGGLPRGWARAWNRGGLPRGWNHVDEAVEKPETAEDTPVPSFIAPLASEHTGWTTTPSPVLWYYISSAWPVKLLFTLNKPKAPEPLVEKKLDAPESEGMYRIDLAAYNVKLEPGVDYEWFVAIILDPRERSADFLASATIRYVEPSGELAGRIKNTPEDRLHFLFAENGYWYDAIANVCRLSNSGEFGKHRLALIDQANLPPVVQYEKKRLGIKETKSPG